MSVRFRYRGTWGNNLFQYLSARLFAEENGLRLETPWTPHMDKRSRFEDRKVINVRPADPGLSVAGDVRKLHEGSPLLDRKWPAANYYLEGYFMVPRWYLERRSRVEGVTRPVPVKKDRSGDIVATVRLGGYVKEGNAVDPSWYHAILEKEDFSRLYVVTDSPRWSWYMDHFKRYGAEIVSGAAHDDWNFIRRFDRVIMANSTFSWWAVYFSQPRKVWTFRRWLKRTPPDFPLPFLPNATPVLGKFVGEGM